MNTSLDNGNGPYQETGVRAVAFGLTPHQTYPHEVRPRSEAGFMLAQRMAIPTGIEFGWGATLKPWRSTMTDKMKERARELAAKSGMSYQAAHNLLRQNENRRATELPAETTPPEATNSTDSSGESGVLMPGAQIPQPNDSAMAQRPQGWWTHEYDCPVRTWQGPEESAPACECLGIDYSLPLLDGDDYYD